MRKSIALASLAVILFPTLAGAEPELLHRVVTLQEAVERVRSVGFEVRAARADAEIAAGDATIARAAVLPQIGVSAVALAANEPQLGMPVARQTYGAGSLSLPLFAPASRPAARAAAGALRAARSTVGEVANDAVFMMVQAYRREQLAMAVLETRHAALVDQADHLRVTEVRVASGKLARFALLRARAALAAASQSAEDAGAERDQARNDLAVLLDLDVASQLGVEELAVVAFDEPIELASARALRQRPAMLAAQERVEAARANLAAARGAYLPSITLTAQSYDGTSSPQLGRSGGQLQVAATLPVLDGGSRAGAIAKAQGTFDRAVALRDQTRLGVLRDLANSYRELAAARRNLATAQSASADADEGLRVARLRERAGKGIQLEVLDALAVDAVAREAVLRSLARFNLAVAAVQHAAGDRPL